MMSSRAESESAALATHSIDVDISDEQFPVLTVRYELRAANPADGRPALLDFRDCPLWPMSIEGSVIEPVVYGEATNVVLEGVSLRPRPGAFWQDGAEITIKLRWSGDSPHPPLLGQDRMKLPADLPTIGRREEEIPVVSAQPSIRLRGGVDQLLAGAISYSRNSGADTRDPFVIAVLTRTSYVNVDVEQRDVQLRLLGESKDSLSNVNRRQIYSTVRQMSRFVGERLGVHPGLRIVVDLDSTRDTRSVAGPLITQALSRFRLPELKQSGLEFPIAREIASSWWGGGVRIVGAEGFCLFGGISFAIGLAWAQLHVHEKDFGVLLDYYRQHMTSNSRFKRVEYRFGERTAGMGMVIYEALAQRPSLWTTLRELTTEYWGYYVPQEVVLERLGKGGVPTRDFTRKRFRRTDIA